MGFHQLLQQAHTLARGRGRGRLRLRVPPATAAGTRSHVPCPCPCAVCRVPRHVSYAVCHVACQAHRCHGVTYIYMQAHVGDNIMRLIDLEIQRQAVRDKVKGRVRVRVRVRGRPCATR